MFVLRACPAHSKQALPSGQSRIRIREGGSILPSVYTTPSNAPKGGRKERQNCHTLSVNLESEGQARPARLHSCERAQGSRVYARE
jgi:hypothetical protein